MEDISNTLKTNIYSASIFKTNFYNYFFKVFVAPPTNDFVSLTGKLSPYFESLKHHVMSNDYSEAINILKQYDSYEKSIKDVDELLELLHDTFTELFLDKTFGIPTVASEYITNKSIASKELDSLKSVYRKNNFIDILTLNLPEDHIATEMLYMQKLNAYLTDAINEDRNVTHILQAQLTFMQAHIMTWLSHFTDAVIDQVADNAYHNIYYATAIIMHHIVNYDKHLTKDFLTSIKQEQENMAKLRMKAKGEEKVEDKAQEHHHAPKETEERQTDTPESQEKPKKTVRKVVRKVVKKKAATEEQPSEEKPKKKVVRKVVKKVVKKGNKEAE